MHYPVKFRKYKSIKATKSHLSTTVINHYPFFLPVSCFLFRFKNPHLFFGQYGEAEILLWQSHRPC